MKASTLTTFHGRIDVPDLRPLFHQFSQLPVVSISDAQRSPFPNMNWQGTVYHGLPLDLFTPVNGSGNYLAFLGRISPEKRVDRAIEIARRAKMKLKIAAKIDAVDREYFEKNVARGLDSPHVEFIGECNGAAKEEFLGNAYALLFPIDWPEPFGLVMIEAAACGTPVVAYRAGSVPEVIESGVTGFIVDSIEGAVRALDKIPSIDRLRCRQVFEERFSSARMAADYTRIYEQLAGFQQRPRLAAIQQRPQRVSWNGGADGERRGKEKDPRNEEGSHRDKKTASCYSPPLGFPD